MLDAELSRTLASLKEHIAEERDTAKLRHLVEEINTLLDLIEKQVTKLEGRTPSRLQ